MNVFLPAFDRVMTATESPLFVSQFMPVASVAGAARASWRNEEDLVRRSVRAMYVTGTFLDLPEESQMHPELQQRMMAYTPELDDTVYDVLDALRDLPEDRRRHVRRTLRSNPDLPLEIAASVNKLAAATDMSRTRRAQVRSSLTQAGWRLGKQNPSLVIDEYVKKIGKFAPRDATDAELLRRYQTIIGQAAFQRAQVHAQSAGIQPPGTAAADPNVNRPVLPAELQSPGGRNRRRGSKAMGLGLLLLGGGGVVVSLGGALGIFAMTAGMVMFGIGLVTFFAGLIQG